MSSKADRLASLADIYQTQKLDGSITQLRLDRIQPSKEQPRHDRTHAIEELAESIQQDGLLSPILVTKEREFYRIVAGERRYHAVRHLGWEQVECRIISREERDYWRIAIIENLQRENLSAQEEAAALLRLKQQEDLSDAALAKLVGKSRNYITEIISIAQLPPAALQQCHSLGIEQRNMLIQVAQSHRRGLLSHFLQAYQRGHIRTVREARNFNQGRGGEGTSDSSATPSTTTIRQTSGTTQTKTANGRTGYLILSKGQQVIIECPGIEEAEALTKHLKRELQIDKL